MPAADAAVNGFLIGSDRETRLRARIDSLLDRSARKERRILELEDRLRLAELDLDERVLVLERRLKHWERRFLEASERLREVLAA